MHHLEILPPDLAEALDELPQTEARALADEWRRLGDLTMPIDAAPTAEVAWRALEANLARSETRQPRRDRPPRRYASTGRLVAAALFVFLAVTVTFLWWSSPVTVSTAPGEVVAHVLPDGSTVTLAPASELTYGRAYGSGQPRRGERRVHLHGEAFFDILPGERLFSIETHDALIEVIGTSFGVRSRPGDVSSETRVRVESGTVRLVSLLRPEDVLTLREGQSGDALSGLISEGRDGEPVGAWRHGGFAIHGLPLRDVLREIERRFDVVVKVGDDLPRDIPLTLFYGRAVEARTVLHDVALAAGLEYRPIRGGYEVNRSTARRP